MIQIIRYWKCSGFYFLMALGMLVLTACSSDRQTGLELSKDSSSGTAVRASDSIKEEGTQAAGSQESAAAPAGSLKPETITVYVCGAVNQPGLYVLPGTARMAEAVDAAQGMTAEADRDILNLAQYMTDGQMIRVPFQGEGADGTSGTFSQNSSEAEDGRIDLNSATSQELQTIPGVGQSKAEAIIQYREEKGRFEKVEDIMQISGIKEASYKKMEPYICVR